jgi:hypothetical protein
MDVYSVCLLREKKTISQVARKVCLCGRLETRRELLCVLNMHGSCGFIVP